MISESLKKYQDGQVTFASSHSLLEQLLARLERALKDMTRCIENKEMEMFWKHAQKSMDILSFLIHESRQMYPGSFGETCQKFYRQTFYILSQASLKKDTQTIEKISLSLEPIRQAYGQKA